MASVRVALLVSLTMVGCSSQPRLDATIYRSEGGVPHIVANDFDSLAYGTAYAAAQDNVCLLARQFVRLRGRLSSYFGGGDGNLESDLFFQLVQDEGQYNQPADPLFEALFVGYAAGYNRYLEDMGVDGLPDDSCRGGEWVQPISAQDARNVHLTPFFLAAFLEMVVGASPPTLEVEHSNTETSTTFVPNITSGKGSNGVAIGRQGAASGNALLFANPHLVWDDDQRFYPMHQIIPGQLNLLGANIFDRASVGIGTNGYVAWTNTVSTARRFSFYRLTLAEEDATSYIVDGLARPMRKITVTVPVRGNDGRLVENSHDFYRTEYGYLVGGRFPWTNEIAFSLRLADEGNRGINGGMTGMYRARTVADLAAVQQQYQFSPTNLIAADINGKVLYGDFGPVVNLDDQRLAECDTGNGVLDGSRSACIWQVSDGTAAPGLLPQADRPMLVRDDFVMNANDSYWLTNPSQPIEDLPRVLGPVGTERTLRTRAGLSHILERLRGRDGLPGRGFTLENIVDVFMSNKNMAGHLLRDDLVKLCKSNPMLPTPGGSTVESRHACEVLEGWDLTANLGSRGAHLFREFLVEANKLAGPNRWPRVLPQALNFRRTFDPANPVTTPGGLDVDDNPNVLIALGAAIDKLRQAGVALDASLGSIQGVTRNREFIPLHGGIELEGVFNKMEFALTGEQAYPAVVGPSATWVMGIELGDDGPRAKGLLTYSVSANPKSPHHMDMTRAFSKKAFIDLPYTEKEVRAAAVSVKHISE